MRRVRNIAKSAFAVAGASLILFGVGACSAQSDSSDGPYAAQFEQARQRSVTDLQRDVLSDDRITDEEFREIRQSYIDCLSKAGISATANPNGQYDFALAPTGVQEEEERRCSDETIGSIEGLYYSLKVNPNNEDFNELIAECLKNNQVVEDSFTTKDWERFVAAFAAAQGAATNEDGSVPLDEDIPNLPTLPGNVAMDDPRVEQCSGNPLNQ